jgi:hypothetical protein
VSKETVELHRAPYPPDITPEQAVEILNAVAWHHRREGYGLLKAPPGGNGANNARGIRCRVDALVNHRTGEHVDIFTKAPDSNHTPNTGEAHPMWHVRPLHAHEKPPEVFVEPTIPEGMAPVTGTGQTPGQTGGGDGSAYDQLVAELRALRDEVIGARGEVVGMRDEVRRMLDQPIDLPGFVGRGPFGMTIVLRPDSALQIRGGQKGKPGTP